jgi:hypothetical protein
MPARVVRRLGDDSAFLVRGAASAEFPRRALAVAQALPGSAWAPIHSRTGTDVHRVVTMVGAGQRQQLQDAGEDTSITTDAASLEVAASFAGFAEIAARACGILREPVIEVEFVRVLAGGGGQHPHMDTYFCAWAFVMCLHDGAPPTNLKDYVYHDYPANMQAGKVVRGWERMGTQAWDWKRGDVMVFKANRIHGGPANPGLLDRHIIFGSSAVKGAVNMYSDSSVIYETTFFGVSPLFHLCSLCFFGVSPRHTLSVYRPLANCCVPFPHR